MSESPRISSMFVVHLNQLINDKKLAFSCLFDIKWIHLLAFRYMKIEGRIHDWIYTNEHIKMFSECQRLIQWNDDKVLYKGHLLRNIIFHHRLAVDLNLDTFLNKTKLADFPIMFVLFSTRKSFNFCYTIFFLKKF